MSAEKAWVEYETKRDEDEKKKKKQKAVALEDMATSAFQKYSEAKNRLKQARGTDGDIVLIDNVLHSIWSGG